MIIKTVDMDEFGFDSIYEHIEICISERGLTMDDVNVAATAQDWIDHGCRQLSGSAIIGVDTITICAEDYSEYKHIRNQVREYFEEDDEIFDIIDNNIIEY